LFVPQVQGVGVVVDVLTGKQERFHVLHNLCHEVASGDLVAEGCAGVAFGGESCCGEVKREGDGVVGFVEVGDVLHE